VARPTSFKSDLHNAKLKYFKSLNGVDLLTREDAFFCKPAVDNIFYLKFLWPIRE